MAKKYGEITKDILRTVALTGIVAVAATSPYFWVRLAKEIERSSKYKKRNIVFNKKAAVKSLAGLNKNKIIIVKKEEGNYTIRLTEKGKRVIRKLQFDAMKIDKPKAWDRRWRIVIFDIPEGNKRRGKILRDAMRSKMKVMGFYQFQKSVWAHPYPCEKEIQLLCEILNVGSFVNIITAAEIYNDDLLREHFKLK